MRTPTICAGCALEIEPVQPAGQPVRWVAAAFPDRPPCVDGGAHRPIRRRCAWGDPPHPIDGHGPIPPGAVVSDGICREHVARFLGLEHGAGPVTIIPGAGAPDRSAALVAAPRRWSWEDVDPDGDSLRPDGDAAPGCDRCGRSPLCCEGDGEATCAGCCGPHPWRPVDGIGGQTRGE